MRNRFDTMLDELDVELIKMGSLCEDAISNAIKAILEDDSYAKKVAEIEEEINSKERLIENNCLKLLLMQHPVASDLRVVSAALKLISDMERIGDQACDIAEMSHYFAKKPLQFQDLEEMANATSKMVKESIDSFVQRDLELARSVMAYDDVVDELFLKIRQEVIDLVGKDTTDGEYLLDIFMIAKYFERIADHATNIVEWVVYSITGVHEHCQ